MTDTWLVVDQPKDNAYWEKRFNDNLQNSDPWILRGDELIFSAELLHEKIMSGFKRIAKSPEGKFEELKIFCSFNLLAGCSLENYLKGLIIKNVSQSKNVEINTL